MSDINFVCSGCKQPLAIEESGAGIEIQCPSCGTNLVVPDPRKAARVAPKLQVSSPRTQRTEPHPNSAPNPTFVDSAAEG